MKAPHKIGLPPNMRVLYVERHEAEKISMDGIREGQLVRFTKRGKGHYRLWLHTNDRILGTYLKLSDDGSIDRVTVRDNEGDQVDIIKPAD